MNEFLTIEAKLITPEDLPHWYVLLTIGDNYTDWKSNRVNRFVAKDLAELVGKTVRAVQTSLKYLYDNKMLIRRGTHDFINPKYYFRGNVQATFSGLYQAIVEDEYRNEEDCPTPVRRKYKRKKASTIEDTVTFDFRGVEPAKDETVKVLSKKSKAETFFEGYDEDGAEIDDEEDTW